MTMADVLLIVIGAVYGGYTPVPTMVTREQCLAVVAETATYDGSYFKVMCIDAKGAVIGRTYKRKD